MTARVGLFRFDVLRPLIAAATIGLATIAPAKAQLYAKPAPFQIEVNFDLSDVQAQIQEDLIGFKHDDQCGQSWDVTDTRVAPGYKGRSIRVDLRGKFTDAQCTLKRRSFGASKSGGRARAHVNDDFDIDVEKKSTSIVGVALELTPTVTAGRVRVDARVVEADATGTLRRLSLEGEIKEALANRLREVFEERIKETIPAALIRAPKLGDVTFLNAGGGKLWMNVKTQGVLSFS